MARFDVNDWSDEFVHHCGYKADDDTCTVSTTSPTVISKDLPICSHENCIFTILPLDKAIEIADEASSKNRNKQVVSIW